MGIPKWDGSETLQPTSPSLWPESCQLLFGFRDPFGLGWRQTIFRFQFAQCCNDKGEGAGGVIAVRGKLPVRDHEVELPAGIAGGGLGQRVSNGEPVAE